MNLPKNLNDPLKRRRWWLELESQWKSAFQTTVFGHNDTPNDEDLERLCAINTIRMAGPTAPYSNMSFELTNLSGISDLTNLEILIVTHHHIQDLKVLTTLVKLSKLFVFNNQISSLEGIENLTLLDQFFGQCNQITNISALKNLINLA
jgi:Leucine-rich repeat (LRR) protein